MQVSLPPFFINKQNIIIRSFLRCGISNAVDGSEDDEIRDEIPRDIEVDITDGAHNEEDPDADIDELDLFSRIRQLADS